MTLDEPNDSIETAPGCRGVVFGARLDWRQDDRIRLELGRHWPRLESSGRRARTRALCPQPVGAHAASKHDGQTRGEGNVTGSRRPGGCVVAKVAAASARLRQGA